MNGANLTKKVMERIEELGGKSINLIAASKSGNADVIACLQGKYIELEIKGKGDKEKLHQAAKLNETIKAGGYGKFIHNMKDLEELLVLIAKNEPCPPVKAKIISIQL